VLCNLCNTAYLKYMKQNFKKLTIVFIVIFIILICAWVVSIKQAQFIKRGKQFGISGIAFLEKNSTSFSFLVVHDNKKENEGRLGILSIDNWNEIKYFLLKWPEYNDLPADLEALTAVPGSNKSFFALASGGKVYHIKVDTFNMNISVINVFTLPNVSTKDNFEGIALQKIDGGLFVVWASRGEDNEPGVISWSLFDLKNYRFTDIKSFNFKSPWPLQPHVRHISDLKVDERGNLFVSSASDFGDDGPFQSAVYIIGSFNKYGGKINFQKNLPIKKILRIYKHKIEGLEIVEDGKYDMVSASDDENMGSYILYGLNPQKFIFVIE